MKTLPLPEAAASLTAACDELCAAAFAVREAIAELHQAAGRSAKTIEILAYRQKKRTG